LLFIAIFARFKPSGGRFCLLIDPGGVDGSTEAVHQMIIERTHYHEPASPI